MPSNIFILLIPILPLASFLLMGLLGKKYIKGYAGWISTIMMGVATTLSITLAYQYFFSFGNVNGIYQKFVPFQLNWLEFSENFSIHIGALLDPISVMMLVVVTFISLMVHIYSMGYMHGESRFATYYAYLGLFTFSMLGLVMSSNIFQIYIFWELVGVSSFLLIGYYFEKPSAIAACKKAFIVTRFADAFFLIGILILSYYTGSFDFITMLSKLSQPNGSELQAIVTSSFLGLSGLTWGLLLVFIGGAGKSAMFPLHIWLPDAMEGPTPVSALIHAATMVVAGVFLVARLFPIYAVDAISLEVVSYVGAFSAFFAAIIACTQTDIKRVLAYSTMSQIGYMMFSLGVARYGGEQGLGYTASMFHLFTHAMFKALLFLGAGAVIHFVHSNEMKDMGGLRKYMPITHLTFLIACLTIAGVPPFAGFFSKEEILLAASHHNTVIYVIALITSAITAFYMFRLYFHIFWNKDAHVHGDHHGEGTWSMKLPLMLLAVGAVFAGFIPFGEYVSSDGAPLHGELHLAFSILPVALGLLGIGLAFLFYKKENNRTTAFTQNIKSIYQAAYHKFYIDELYLFITQNFVFKILGKGSAWIDKNIINGIVDKSATETESLSQRMKTMQSGKVQEYAMYFLGGIILFSILYMYLWK